MTDIIATSFKRSQDWQLLAEFAVKSLSSSEQILADSVMEIVRNLGLQPAQLERIDEMMTQVLKRAIRSLQQMKHLYPLHIRIWSSGICVDGSGWGFFIVEKKGFEPQLTTGEAAYVVELYLYQERHS